MTLSHLYLLALAQIVAKCLLALSLVSVHKTTIIYYSHKSQESQCHKGNKTMTCSVLCVIIPNNSACNIFVIVSQLLIYYVVH